MGLLTIIGITDDWHDSFYYQPYVTSTDEISKLIANLAS